MQTKKVYDETAEDFTKTVYIDSSPDIIYNLLTTTDNISIWWQNEVSGSTEHNGKVHFSFENPEEYIIANVEIAEFNAEVLWRVTEDTRTATGEWIGTGILFLLKRDGTKTQLRLRHIGLTPALGSYRTKSENWNRLVENIVREAESRGEQDRGM